MNTSPSPPSDPLDLLAINTLRTLAMDAVQKANSGHPGTPMALAPVAYTLWSRYLRYDPAHPDWPNRDRFVLSAGHASMLLYGLLHLAGVVELDRHDQPTGQPAVSLDDIKQFRQLDSKTPGHPEYGLTTGVETTTGPLGQGCANSVGMALAQRHLASRYNRDGHTLFDYNVYVICGDGDMMEGVSGEAASLAGHQKLGNLCWIYDNNTITIEGHTELAFSENVAARFAAYGWNTVHVPDANDTEAFARAIEHFQATNDRPTLIVVDSVIGYGAPNKHNTAAAHGEALGEDEVRLAKRAYGWPEDAKFRVPDEVRHRLRDAMDRRTGGAWQQWQDKLDALDPALAGALRAQQEGTLPADWDKDIPAFPADAKGKATRDTGGQVLNACARHIPWLLGGAADLAPSTKTLLTFEGAGSLQPGTPGGRNMHFGVREHAMGAIANGMALCGLRPYTATFLIFSDYMKPPMRLAALMELPAIFVFTHDSIGLGEDGPTHQPVEQMSQLRGIPSMRVLRPCDANEVAEAWRIALRQTHRPTALVLSRQPLPTLDREKYAPASGAARGAYVLADCAPQAPAVILMATGSEVALCLQAYEQLTSEGIAARVVSMPCWDLFEEQDAAYRDSVLPPSVAGRVAVEQAGPLGWDRYIGATGDKIVMNSFGASAPFAKLQAKFGFTIENVVRAARDQAKKHGSIQ
ncbi:transketolase [Achromobacter aloeverae]|uniref:Transketolase n=1 Tax=Achromobacter aloeverae TaxID=1750518 RepID=A0A4Q1HEM3_9BURK|nr:transketolase [Achromobacter aloeverae]RXN85103.1 transketolase [Achromobacter aloeverae]